MFAAAVIDLVMDEGTFESWDRPVELAGLPQTYLRELVAASERAGTDESVLTGRGLVGGRPIAVLVSEFSFLGGSIGVAAAARITSAVRRATVEGLPLVASTASGGTRMQEGTPAFFEMVAIARAVMAHRAAGLPYLVHLRHPTTGGVYASWGSLGHLTLAEPNALIGFLGPKVYEALEGHPFPSGVQRAENLAEKGVIDAVVATDDLPAVIDKTLAVLVDAPVPPSLPLRPDGLGSSLPVWESVEQTRRDDRVGLRDVLRYGAHGTIALNGTEESEQDAAILVALTRIDGQPCVLVGQDRNQSVPLGPAALRRARRGMKLAQELGLPLVTVIDTAGAELSPEAEEGAIAGEIARCIATLTTMSTPTVSVILGQGCGGGALALLPAQVVVATENAWLAPLPPEGASVIRFGDTAHAAEMAHSQGIGSAALLESGIVHHVVAELAGEDVESLATAVAARVAQELVRLTG